MAKAKKLFKRSVLDAAIGISIILFAVALLLNQLPLLQVSFAFFYIFGLMYYVIFGLMILYGFYYIFKSKISIRSRISLRNYPLQIVGGVLFIIGVFTLVGVISSYTFTDFTITNFVSKHHSIFNDFLNPYDAMKPLDIFSLGEASFGGFIGMFFAGLARLGTSSKVIPSLVITLTLLISLVFMLIKPIISLVKTIKGKIAFRKKKAAEYEEIAKGDPSDTRVTALSETKKTTAAPVLLAEQEPNDFENNPSAGMEKARLGGSIGREHEVTRKPSTTTFFEQIVDEGKDDFDEAVDEIETEEIEFAEEIETEQIESTIKPIFSRPEPEIITVQNAPEKPAVIEQEENTRKIVSKKPKKYVYPPINLLDPLVPDKNYESNVLLADSRLEDINHIFEDLEVGAKVISYKIGPAVTRYDVQYDTRVKANAVRNIIQDISIRLGGVNARFEELVRGKNTSGLEVQNAKTSTVFFKDVMQKISNDPKDQFAIPFGKDIEGEVTFGNLNEFPHILVAGTTGSGKSVFVHALLMTIIMRNSPEDLKLVLIDPKRVEMSKYRNIGHLLCPIITDPAEAKVALDKLVDEMENRYRVFEKYEVNSIISYNRYAASENLPKLPYIVIVVDEFADLMDASNREVEIAVKRLGQKARAAGVHMVIATQRPSVKVITGDIKANINTRVALACASPIDSVTMIGQGGAEQLLGYGDMLVDSSVVSRSGLVRLQGCYVSEDEMRRVCNFIREQGEPEYDPNFLDLRSDDEINAANFAGGELDLSGITNDEERYQKVKECAFGRDYISISFIQVSFAPCGFNTARKYFIRLQNEGIVEKIVSNPSRGGLVLVHSEVELQRKKDLDNND